MRELPELFVIKPARGSNKRGVYVVSGSRELISGRELSIPELYRELRERRGLFSFNQLVAEEMVRSEDGEYRLPTEYKLHMFGGCLAAVQVFTRYSLG